MIKKKLLPILITGSHRSGSTWVGKMLALSDDLGYIHEPFNPEISVCRSRFDYWFTYVCEENEEKFKPHIQDVLQFKYRARQELKNLTSIIDLARIVRDSYKFLRYRQLNKRPLVKDPIALFSAGWLSDTFDMRVLVLIRHPAAFVGSLKKGNTTFPFEHLLRQELLINHHLSTFKSEIEKYSFQPPDIVDQGILLWNIFHTVILKYRDSEKKQWIFKKHEDLSRDPLNGFRQIYNEFGFEFNPFVINKIKEFTSTVSDTNEFKRNSKKNIRSWEKRLTQKEILRIREKTSMIADKFYDSDEW